MNIPLVIFSSQDFDDLPTRKHKLAKRFAQNGAKVLYIEAPFTYLSTFKDTTYKPKVARAGQIKQAFENLWVASPPPMMPFYGRFPFAQKKACGKLANFAKKAMDQIGFPKDFTCLFYLPWMAPIAKALSPKVTLYDCVDDHSGYGGTSSKSFLEAEEAKLCGLCDIVFATAKALAERLSKFNPNTVYMPNAVDAGLFKPTSPSNEVAAIPTPRVAYAGALRWWFDAALLSAVATARPNVHFIIVGEERNGELGHEGQNLRSLPNVHFLGKRPQAELPSLLSGSSCGIIPFKNSGLISSVSPLKLYEYASMGLPTVSVPMTELADMPEDVVKIAATYDDFGKMIDDVIMNASSLQAILKFARENTWDERLKMFEEKLLTQWQR